jgi:RNA polymerase sigma-70 factor (ECF subfamily)
VEPRPDEEALLERAAQGDLAAFNLLVEHYQTTVYNLCLRMLSAPQSAEDATQEAFISAYRYLSSFRGGSFRSWLYRIATNACYDELRRWKVRRASSLDAEGEEDGAHAEAVSGEPTPDQVAEQTELRDAIQSALSALPADQRAAIVLCDIQGLEYDEIARVMRCSLGTVKSRISRARMKLRAALIREGGELLPSRFRHQGEDK